VEKTTAAGGGAQQLLHGRSETAEEGVSRPVKMPVPEMDRGWRAWKVVLGAFCLTLPTYGLLSAVGLFQTYWRDHQLQGYSESEVSWIVSVFGFLMVFLAGPVGVVFDMFGGVACGWILGVSSVVYVGGWVGLGFCDGFGGFMGVMALSGGAAGMFFLLLVSLVMGGAIWSLC